MYAYFLQTRTQDATVHSLHYTKAHDAKNLLVHWILLGSSAVALKVE